MAILPQVKFLSLLQLLGFGDYGALLNLDYQLSVAGQGEHRADWSHLDTTWRWSAEIATTPLTLYNLKERKKERKKEDLLGLASQERQGGSLLRSKCLVNMPSAVQTCHLSGYYHMLRIYNMATTGLAVCLIFYMMDPPQS
ncbi:hypothetical protein ACJX0J_030074 [Zea mays]